MALLNLDLMQRHIQTALTMLSTRFVNFQEWLAITRSHYQVLLFTKVRKMSAALM